MLVHLYQYKHEEVQFDDNRTTGESQTEDTVDKDSEEYFGENIDQFDADTWETVEHEGDPIQRRSVTLSGVTAVSVPQDLHDEEDEDEDESDPDLPGKSIQLRLGGGLEFLDNAVFVEAQDEEPADEEPEGKTSPSVSEDS
ncbi:hypothetical protein [Halalkalicoccus ordinarius]|uniref:hypothetical protein n=1 Tax=Halalkalicoccus ordinarius TaxID=3116651 RepID=UPI00300EA083